MPVCINAVKRTKVRIVHVCMVNQPTLHDGFASVRGSGFENHSMAVVFDEKTWKF